MTNTSPLRTFLIGTLATTDGPQGTKLLDFTGPVVKGGKLDAEAIYERISEILPWHLINEIKHGPERAITLPGKMEVIVDALLQARESWRAGARDSDFGKLITSFIVYDRAFMIPEKDLDWEMDLEGIRRAITNTIGTLKLSIEVNTSHHAGYTDKKFLSDFDKAVRSNNLAGIFDFFRTIDHSGGLYSSDIALLQHISRMSSVANVHELISFSKGSKALVQKIIIQAVHKDLLFSNLDALNSAGVLANLIVLDDYFSSQNIPNNRSDNVDFEMEKGLLAIIKNVEKYATPSKVIPFICKTLNVKPNKATNSLFSMFVAQSKADIQDYVDALDFSYDDSGEKAFGAQIAMGDEATLDTLSTAITERYFTYLSNLDYRPDFFMFSSYYNFFLRTVGIKTQKNLPEYIDGLEQASLAVIRSLSSWKPDEVPIFTTKWVYWIMAIKQLNLVVSDIATIPYTESLLQNMNFRDRLSKEIGEDAIIDFEWLRTFLVSPDSINEVHIYDGDKHLRLCW